MVEGQVHLKDAVGRTRVPVPDRIYSCNRSQVVPGHGLLGHATPLRPLYGPGMYEGGGAKDLMGCLRKARLFPLRPLHRDLASEPYKLFSEIKSQIPKPSLCEQVRQALISDETWASIDARLTARW